VVFISPQKFLSQSNGGLGNYSMKSIKAECVVFYFWDGCCYNKIQSFGIDKKT